MRFLVEVPNFSFPALSLFDLILLSTFPLSGIEQFSSFHSTPCVFIYFIKEFVRIVLKVSESIYNVCSAAFVLCSTHISSLRAYCRRIAEL